LVERQCEKEEIKINLTAKNDKKRIWQRKTNIQVGEAEDI
jgi:hypothetical protein